MNISKFFFLFRDNEIAIFRWNMPNFIKPKLGKISKNPQI